MTADDTPPRKPRAFSLDDARLKPEAPVLPELAASAPDGGALEGEGGALTPVSAHAFASMPLRGVRWGSVLISALSALISLALGLWVWDFVAGLFTRGGWLGASALVLAALAGVSALMIASREIVGLWRLGRVATFREQAAYVLRGESGKSLALDVSTGVERLFSGRAESAWGVRRLREHRGDVLDAREVLILTERELLTPLDAGARALIAASMGRVSVVTAVSPSALVDVGFVAFANLRMLRQLATLYGGRPGVFGVLRLARLVAGHLLLTGGMAVGEDVLQQLAGHGLTARLSARLGEGLMNGAFTGRIGIAAVELCRPLPFIEAERPRLRDLITELRATAG